VISSWQKPIPTQHTTEEANTRALSGIQTRDSSNEPSADYALVLTATGIGPIIEEVRALRILD
jgi:hypothetical protein